MTHEASTATTMLGSIVYAIIILAVGFWGAKMVSRLLRGIMERRDMDQALTGFIGNLTKFENLAPERYADFGPME